VELGEIMAHVVVTSSWKRETRWR